MQEKTNSVAAASAAIGLNIHKGKSRILRCKIACTNPITIDGEDLEDVKTSTYLGSITDEQGGSDADVKARIEDKTTMEENWKGINEALTSTCQEVLDRKKYHHKERISIENPNKIQERKNKKTATNNSGTRTEDVKVQTEYTEANKTAPLNSSDIEVAPTYLPICVTLPIVEGMGVGIKLLKVDKAAGSENIPTRRLKLDMKVIAQMRHISCRQIWEGGQVPSDWREGHFIKIPKKRDLSKCENYKDITLLSVARKVFNSVSEPDESFSRRPTSRSTDP
ncbi:unnamed protein product [Schistosoma curassoni]|uniref:Reverse transcriptase domain-containing protein n=1 Tax=Schistosoma curassoni TaxID=6186 RepID=A0A183KU73_9TREM|nr:unnamed protein product [Schistosoma curassoni]